MNARLAVSASVIALSLIACTNQEDAPEADADGTSERRSIGHDEDAAVASLGPSWSAELTQDLPIEPSAASVLPRRKRLKPFKVIRVAL